MSPHKTQSVETGTVRKNQMTHRPILGPAGNKTQSVETRIPMSKPQRIQEKSQEIKAKERQSPIAAAPPTPPLLSPQCRSAPSILRHLEQLSRRNFSLSASCSSDASSDSSHSRASTGRAVRQSRTLSRRKQCGPKMGKVVKCGSDDLQKPSESQDTVTTTVKKRCTWVTPNTDPCYAAFHDEEWGVPVHDDKKLFELLSLSGALAELTWPAILKKRNSLREIFLDFDPVVVSKLNERKITSPGSSASSLLSELKLRSIIENARQMCKITNEFGSFDKYIWAFVNHKPIVGQFRYPRQVPVKTSKADFISKDLLRRGFRGVSPTVIYSFMQVSGMTNDHLISCFRFRELSGADDGLNPDNCKAKVELGNKNSNALELGEAIDDLSLSSV